MTRLTTLACLAVALALPRLAPASPYTVKDAGPEPYSAASNYDDLFIQARHFAPRIDAEGEVSTRDSYRPDHKPGKLGSVTAPYRPGGMGLYTESADARYQVGWVTGEHPASPWQALLWDNQAGTGQALGTTPYMPDFTGPYRPDPDGGWWFSIGYGVNDSGHAVGASHDRAMVWGIGPDGDDPLAAFRPVLDPFDSAAFGINNLDEIVGFYGGTADPRAFLISGGQLLDLNELLPVDSGWDLEVATGINDDGQIVGLGRDPSGSLRRFLLATTAVPEPSSLVLFGLVLAAAGARRRRVAEIMSRPTP
jgi:hypothetical protein